MHIRITQCIRVVCYFILLAGTSTASASELIHQFNSPAFSGQGYSSHVLAIEQLESQRKQKLKDEAKSLADQLARDAKNTNQAKFLNNLESRIYAQLSKQLADQMFAENGATQGTMDFQGTTISWVNLGSEVQMTITNTDGTQTVLTVPIGTFGF
jgi:curli production assembly/transport component CsgF